MFTISTTKVYPILGDQYQSQDFTPIKLDIAPDQITALQLDTFQGLKQYISTALKKEYASVGYGGYLEKRNIYLASPLFEDKRNIHLGLDLWVPAHTNIHAPIQGEVHSFRYNDNTLDYGATIILKHKLEGQHFHTLYGHLSLNSLKGLAKGKEIKQGQIFAQTGDPTENGGWYPHLHFQLIKNMMKMDGDYPGVTSEQHLKRYQDNCPDPACLFRMEIE